MVNKNNSLTDWLRQVGEEEVKICIDGQSLTVSKTEAVARKLFLLAHGGVEEVTNEDGKIVKVFHKPDFRVAKIIREFLEGKPNQEPAPEKKKGKRAGNFNSKISKRLNESAAVNKSPCTRSAIRPLTKPKIKIEGE